MSRLEDLERFYQLLDELSVRLGGPRTLAEARSYRGWPERGVYFFFEPGEIRRASGAGFRVVRVGTHALTSHSRSTLRQRLGQHGGPMSGAGNHRGSIFRLLIGQSLMRRGDVRPCLSWGVKSDAGKASEALGLQKASLVALERPVEEAVSRYLAAMTFLWLDIDDEPGPESQRGYIERNAIALLSDYERTPRDPPSEHWLGRFSDRSLVSGSGLWNQRHVTETHDHSFLGVFEQFAKRGESM